ncbi:MAG: hypothetical protein K6A34_06260 [Methanobrevibacter sp.]|nr:hypothetical protein [Methanobrevibacter sp.]
MFHEAIIKFRINYQKNKKDAEKMANRFVEFIKEYEECAIVFFENPELVEIKECGVDCNSCEYCSSEEVCIGDRGDGPEWVVKHWCRKEEKEVHPMWIHFCDDYKKRKVNQNDL